MPPQEFVPRWLAPVLSAESADLSGIFLRLGMCVLLGFLVGLQRERTEAGMPGLRTFPLIALAGGVFATIGTMIGAWVPAAALLALVALLFFPQWLRIHQTEPDPGITTSMAAILMYGAGALLVLARLEIGVVVGGVIAVLLQFKPEMHRFSDQLAADDLRAIMQFVLISCIILPVLPNTPIDPYGVIRPFNVWLMVVLIVAISLSGYIAYKLVGQGAGVLLSGLLGGAVSSTAATISAARQVKANRNLLSAGTVIILLASTVMFARVFLEMLVINQTFFMRSVPPLLTLAVATLLPALAFWRRTRQSPPLTADAKNPTHMRTAIVFAAAYAVVLFLLAAVKDGLGDRGLFALAFLSGLHDMDAVTLSLARMASADTAIMENGWRYLTVAVLANMLVKSAFAGILGGWKLGRDVAFAFAVPAAVGILLILIF
ncbi:MAG: MgtC/SapB family protein [Thermogutta sp.]